MATPCFLEDIRAVRLRNPSSFGSVLLANALSGLGRYACVLGARLLVPEHSLGSRRAARTAARAPPLPRRVARQGKPTKRWTPIRGGLRSADQILGNEPISESAIWRCSAMLQ